MRVAILFFSWLLASTVLAFDPCGVNGTILLDSGTIGGPRRHLNVQEFSTLFSPPRIFIEAAHNDDFSGYELRVHYAPWLLGGPDLYVMETKPSEWWFIAWIQDAVNTAGPGSPIYCTFTTLIPNLFIIEHSSPGETIDISWLYGDVDGDGINNLLDPDQFLSCYSLEDPFNFDGCDGVITSVRSTTPEWEVQPDGTFPIAPQVNGDPADNYACGTRADAIPSPGETYNYTQAQQIFEAWTLNEWRDPAVFEQPSHDPPYWQPYNMVRAGPGGAFSAYFSAPWGKKVGYCAFSAEDVTQAYRKAVAPAWHRYVLIGGEFAIQYWHVGQQCWRPIGLMYNAPNGTGFPHAGGYVSEKLLSSLYLHKFVPRGYFPGDMVGELQSNHPNGVLRLPAFAPESWGAWWNAQQGLAAASGGGSGQSGARAMTSGEMEKAVYNAIAKASRGTAADGADAVLGRMGQGGTEAATEVFGSAVPGDGGNGAASMEAAEGVGDGVLQNITDSLQLADIAPETQAAGEYTVTIPKPGGGEFALLLSTIPDTGTNMGLAMEAIRVLMRVLFVVGICWVYVGKSMTLFKEVT